MSALSIEVPFPVFQDRDGQPLDNGYIWIGQVNLNPQTNPVVAYYDAALTIPAVQPLRTINGYVSNAGTPARIYVDGNNFSILVQDSKGSMIYSFPQGTGIEPVPNNASGIVYDPAGAGAVPTTVQTKLRESISVKDFGAVGDGVTNDTDAFAAASAAINAAGGGKLIIPEGTYIVGKQTFAGATGLGYAYRAADIIRIQNCLQPVVIEGNGAVIKVAAGLRFGSFDPVTGAPFASVPPFYNPDYTSSIGQVIYISGCKNITVNDLEIDGNINNQIIGGQWGDTGWQLSARGILDLENDNVYVKNVYSHHHGLDGFETKRTVTSSTANLYPHTYVNCVSTYNGRQGMSWTGGNHLTCISCDFSHTQKNGVVASAPGAGLDIEPETSLGINGTFINCRFYDNGGVGMLASTGPSSDCAFYNCQMIGTTFWSGWAQQPAASRYRFHDCEIVGAWVWPGGSNDPESAAKWFGCKFFMDPAKSPSGVIYQNRMNFDFSQNVLWEGCVFYSASGYTLPFSNAGVDGAVYSNCTFEQDGAGTFLTRGNFYGHCRIIHAGFWDSSGTIVFGRLYVNGVENRISLPEVFQLKLFSNDGGTGKAVRVVSNFSATAWAASVGGAIQGDIVLAPNPSSGGFIGEVCTVAGNPGTWKAFGLIA